MFIYRFPLFLSRCFQSSLLQNSCTWERVNLFPHTTNLQQVTLNIFCQNIEILYNRMDNLYDKKWETLWQKEKFVVLSNFLFCHYVFKKLSAAEASESVYMRERVNREDRKYNHSFWQLVIYPLTQQDTTIYSGRPWTTL